MTAIQVFKKYGAHYYDDDEEAIIKAMDEYAESKAKEAWNAAHEVIDESITIPGEVWKYPDYETYKTKQNA